jgi:hypothetical protein
MAEIIDAISKITIIKTNHHNALILIAKAEVKPTNVTNVASNNVCAVLAIAL